ncbi:MAG: hypothetical protein JO139_09170 [Alphaproteobacteria bacterium]|nr:hypothetical protein [Alphaproteobacteria bacterium]
MQISIPAGECCIEARRTDFYEMAMLSPSFAMTSALTFNAFPSAFIPVSQ